MGEFVPVEIFVSQNPGEFTESNTKIFTFRYFWMLIHRKTHNQTVNIFHLSDIKAVGLYVNFMKEFKWFPPNKDETKVDDIVH